MSISLSKSLRAKKVEVIAYLRIFYFISITKKKKKNEDGRQGKERNGGCTGWDA